MQTRVVLVSMVVGAALTACGGDDGPSDDVPGIDAPTMVEFAYPSLPGEPQRPGDPAAGYDYLINGGYITCGLPKSFYDRVFGAADPADRLPGRTGDNTNLPFNYSAALSREGVKVVSANCLSCHASRINGELVVGLGAANMDFTGNQAAQIHAAGSLIEDPTEHMAWERFDARMQAIGPYIQTLVVGANPADNLTAALMSHRDPATLAWSETAMRPLPPTVVVPVDVPPWWRMKKKTAMFYSAGGRGDHARIMMSASLLCTDDVAEARAIDEAFVDVRAWIEQLQAPAYPFELDADLAARGKPVFERTCARCHGTYGDGGVYPSSLVPLPDIGTDSALANGASQFGADYVQWFAQSFWGETSRLVPELGYIAPPLDGVWATAPFLHNGSVPTIEALLDSSKRPTYWTRSFDTRDYDTADVGWHYTVVDHGQDAEPNRQTRVKLYDTTLPGYSNAGHTFGDELTPDERHAVLEYLKTL